MSNVICSQKGIAALPSILIITLILLAVGLILTTTSVIESTISFAQRKSLESFYLTEAGLKDALMKITRNKNYTGADDLTCSAGVCTLTFDDNKKAEITVTGTDPKTVIVIGSVGNIKRKISNVVNVDTYGKVTHQSWEEIE